jgi:glutathione peroxidase
MRQIYYVYLWKNRCPWDFVHLQKQKMMKKIFTFLSASLLTLSAIAQTSFYDLKARTIDGKDFSFADLKGKKVMIVNTASECGLTPQYEDLEKLYKEYKDQNFTIIGFPANDFGKQEPGSNEQISEFCKKNYGVSFQMMEKITVKGENMDPVYKWLTSKEKNGKEDSDVKWNFQKYLIDEKGNLVEVISPRVKPTDEKIISFIKK